MKTKEKQVALRMDDKLYEIVSKFAEKKEISLSKAIRILIIRALKK